ncbi:MAG: GrpB family protein [Bryobacteraceae bacterium]|nr:GrpB family protein [Bryobacteraceae bacterium]
MKPVIVSDYDPAWPHWFDQLRERIWPAVSDLALAIEHVGSTSVPGLAAKPVIDLDIVIGTPADLPAIAERLAALGYRHRGNLGIEDRDAFRHSGSSHPPHHLYVCPAGSLALHNHLVLRDHLRVHPTCAAEYAQLKLNLARQHPFDMDSYVEGKSAFILHVLALHGLDPRALTAISDANRSH